MSVIINGTTGVTFPDSVLQTSGVPGPGSSGNVLTSNGTIWVSQAAAAFDSGTAMVFKQTAAPTGWTKSTALNDYALRVVSGTASTGGSVAFTTAFASQTPAGSINTSGLSAGATTLSTTQIPSHNHTASMGNTNYGSGSVNTASNQGDTGSNPGTLTTSSTGGGSSHTHSVSGSATFSGTAINLAVQYADVIIATKN